MLFGQRFAFSVAFSNETARLRVREVENSGIWPQGPFVARHRIPKPANVTSPFDQDGNGSYYTPEDLKMGTEVNAIRWPNTLAFENA